ncbi:MAG: methyltransferase domain-containing protein [Actinomycetota bacterium]|nr:methyltransferase domain-containing protein [Actinomycetota bacterium]
MEERLYELPFDQFQRYKVVEEIVNLARDDKPLKILDVGGYPGLISDFLPNDETYILDVVSCERPNYIRGDGTSLPFTDGAFDMVVAIDTLEHVPIEKRQDFISEVLRVGSKLTVVMGPFYSEDIELAERIIFEFSLKTLGKDFAEGHPLKEHIEHGLPKIDAFEAELNQRDCSFLIFPSGYLYHWQALNFVKHFLFTIPDSDDLLKMVDKYYNSYFYEEDKRDPSYRHMFVIARDRDSKLLSRIEKGFHRTPPASFKDLSYKLQLFDLLFSLFDLGSRRELDAVKKRNLQLEKEIEAKDSQLEALRASLDQLEGEEKALRAMIADLESQIERLRGLKEGKREGAVK